MDDDLIADIFAGLGKVTTRRMFSGKGIYHDGLIVGVVLRGELMLKADEVTAPDFAAAGARRFTYPNKRSGKIVEMPYWTIPDGAIDDPDALAGWTRKAYEAALRSAR